MGREDSSSRPPAPSPPPACLHPFRGEPSGGCGIEVSVYPRLAPLPRSLSPDLGPQGSPPDRPLCLSQFSTDDPLLLVEPRGLSGSHRRSQPEVGLRSGLPLPSDFPPQESCQEVGKVKGDLPTCHPLLGRPDVVCVSSGASRVGRLPPSIQRRPHCQPDDGRASFKPGEAVSSRVDDFRGCWGVDAISYGSFSLISAG
jgi:hypothetical protein